VLLLVVVSFLVSVFEKVETCSSDAHTCIKNSSIKKAFSLIIFMQTANKHDQLHIMIWEGPNIMLAYRTAAVLSLVIPNMG